MSFPLIKLGYLAMRQISRPLANAIKNKAKTNDFVRNKVLLPPAQIYHNVESYLIKKTFKVMWTSKAKPLSVDEAIDLSADILENVVIFSIAATIVLYEYRRQYQRDINKACIINEALLSIKSQMKEANDSIGKHSKILDELEKNVFVVPTSTAQNAKQIKENQSENKIKGTIAKLPVKIKDIDSQIVMHVVNDVDNKRRLSTI